MRKKLLAGLLLTLLLLPLCAGCADEPVKPEESVLPEESVRQGEETFDIPTSLVTLKYPAKWQGLVTVEATDAEVKFSYAGHPVFDLLFREGEEYLLGTYRGTPISILSYNVERDALSEQEYNNFCAMSADVNVILRHLSEDPDFVINQ